VYKKLDEGYYVENPFLAHLQKLGWQIFRQNKDNPEDVKEIKSFNSSGEPVYGKSVKFRENFREVILEEELKNSIKRINPWIEKDQITEVIRRITTPQANSPLETNREIHDLLLENIIPSLPSLSIKLMSRVQKSILFPISSSLLMACLS